MSARFFTKGLVLAATADSAAGDTTATFKAGLIRPATGDTALKIITAATNATPVNITSTAHGFTNGDIVIIGGILGNLSANGTFKVANVAANTFDLQTLDGVSVVGSGAYTSGGWAVNISLGAFLVDIDGCSVGTDQTLASVTQALGAINATNPSWTAVADPGAGVTGDVIAVVYYKSTGAAGTSPLIAINDGRIRVVCAANAAAAATTLAVEKLDGPIPNGTVLVFSNGLSVTLTAVAAENDRTLTVSALGGAGVAAGHAADVYTTSAGLPVHPNGGNISLTLDVGVKKLAAFTQP